MINVWNRKRGIMKKIFSAVMLVLTMAFLIEPVYACSKDFGNMTGGACSIRELNKMTEAGAVKEKVSNPKEERDLRPIRIDNKIEYNPECLYGNCIWKIFMKQTK